MKKTTVFLNILVALILVSSYGIAQKASTPDFKAYNGFIITSIADNKSAPMIIGGSEADKKNINTATGKTEKLTWKISVKVEDQSSLTFSKELRRIQASFPAGPFGMANYDSDNVFESTDGSERFVNNLLPILQKPYSRKFTIQGQPLNELFEENKAEDLWNTGLPVLDRTKYWAGLFFTASTPSELEKNTTWVDTLELLDSRVKNVYTITDSDKDKIIIGLESKQVYTGNNSSESNLRGAPVPMSINRKSRTLQGKLYIDPQTLFIKSMDFNIETESELIISGESSPRKSESVLTLVNTIKKLKVK